MITAKPPMSPNIWLSAEEIKDMTRKLILTILFFNRISLIRVIYVRSELSDHFKTKISEPVAEASIEMKGQSEELLTSSEKHDGTKRIVKHVCFEIK